MESHAVSGINKSLNMWDCHPFIFDNSKKNPSKAQTDFLKKFIQTDVIISAVEWRRASEWRWAQHDKRLLQFAVFELRVPRTVHAGDTGNCSPESHFPKPWREQ